MNRSLALKRLCWKEYRQLLPLIVMLAAIGLMFQLLFLMSYEPNQLDVHHLFLVGLPALFAAGVGALLVGQERDTRSLFWMASLPIPRKDIIWVKFLAGIVGLLVVWGISFSLFLFSYLVSNGRFAIRPEWDVWYSFLYSVFLLVVSFATAWSFRSTFVGLLALVGVAIGFTVLSNIFLAPLTKDIYSTIAMILCIAVGIWVGLGAAKRALEPSVAPRSASRTLEASSFFERSIVDRRRIQSPWSALVWQFATQNRAMLVGLASLLLVLLTVVCLAVFFESRYANSPIESIGKSTSLFVGPSLMIAFVAVSWVGVVTFQGDNLNQRIRFLSDRGISPKTVWLTRQILPLGLLVLTITALVVVAAFMIFLSNSLSWLPSVGWLVLIATGIVWTIYSVTQWMSQIVRSPVIAAILAPVVAGLPFAYGAFLLDPLESPIWLLAITTCIPMIATFRMTRHWMDARMGKHFWLEHGGWLAATILLPTVPFWVVYFTYPTIPGSELTKFYADASKNPNWSIPRVEISLLPRQEPPPSEQDIKNDTDSSASDAIGAASVGTSGMGEGPPSEVRIPFDATRTEERELQLLHIEQQLRRVDYSTPLMSSVAQVRLMGDAVLVRMRMQDDGKTEELLSRYRRDIRLIKRITHGFRMDATLKMQQNADRSEAWLVQEVLLSEAKEMMGSELRDTLVAQLRDKDSRQKARLRALADDLVWRKFATNPEGHGLGGYEIPTKRNGTRLMAKRHVATVAWHLKQYLNASDSIAKLRAKEAIVRDWEIPMKELELTETSFVMQGWPSAPCCLWFGEWEKQADAL